MDFLQCLTGLCPVRLQASALWLPIKQPFHKPVNQPPGNPKNQPTQKPAILKYSHKPIFPGVLRIYAN
ncbi:MAG: hypothetical protein C4519_06565 [Desulfobacteraceae bacterium]|nr:MAG: hypothetical protein C4519_06565 [Desulfobacteraceae bacterium]